MVLLLALLLLLFGCRGASEAPAPPRPSILLVTLDTTRYDAMRPDVAPQFNALANEGLRFRQAYTPVPQTLAAHCSMMTGLYPAGHGVHENGRYLSEKQPLLAEQMKRDGYRTAAFASAFALARRFGLARGFDVYDDAMPEPQEERSSKETTDRVIAYLDGPPVNGAPASAGTRPAKAGAPLPKAGAPLFLWVHFYDPHFPYDPPEPYRTRYAETPYLGEVAAMDEQIGRLVQAFRQKVKEPVAVIIVGDHGEGLGDHGESQHGDLLYQSTMHVPLLLIGPGIAPGVNDAPVSSRRVFHTILDWAGLGAAHSLRQPDSEVVLGEAMKPFLDYGWRPQVMAVDGRQKTILAGKLEVYDVIADPSEAHDLTATASVPRNVRVALQEYPIPSSDAPPPSAANEEERRKLASLGYVAATAKPVIRADAPRPADMTRLFDILDKAAQFFARGQYAASIPLLEKILVEDPHNLDAALRLATAYASLGRNTQALAAFQKAEAIAPDSDDVRTYLGLFYGRGPDWPKAELLLDRVLANEPDRLPALEGMALVRERQGRIADAIRIRQRIYTMRTPSPGELVQLGEMAMAVGNTPVAIDAFEHAHSGHDLELGVLYLAAGRVEDARAALDRVAPSDPGYPMALFKRAQVSVLLHEADAAARIESAREHANATTGPLIARERLFRPSS